ncbi:hypothetical protein H5410_050310 [Solanum commersonii]|uniref:Uncharacterized protein n=1 Tax=Solanum commersonii TaxID=4109 RepID=A0A9J5WV33_SOLCO|nr:hypothetical protein H5410_050310 [Solanum commersonii]
MDSPWVTKGRSKEHIPRRRGRSFPGPSSESSYRSSSNSPILQRGGMSLINSKVSQKATSSSVHLEDILEGSLLYAELQAYLSQKQSDTFASIAKDDIDDIRSYERAAKKEMIFLLENSEIQRKEEPWKIFQRYLLNRYTSPGILGYILDERKADQPEQICAKIFADPIPNWFLNWWSYHCPTTKILPDPFLKLYKNWVKVSPDLNDLYHSDHI